jgi:HlyD family secretion protein
VPVVSEVAAETEVLSVVRDGTRVQRGDLICTLDPAALDEEKAWQVVAVRRAKAAYENARMTREVAEVALAEYKEAIHKQEVQTVRGEISLAEAERKRAEDRLEWSNRMKDKGFVSSGQNIADKVALKQKVFAYEQAQTKIKILEKFTYPRTVKGLEIEVAKARSDEEAKELTWDLEKKGLAAIEQQIEHCRIYAPATGRLVHARWKPPGTTGKPTTVAVGRTVRWRQLLFRIVPGKPPADELKSPPGPRSGLTHE